MPGPKRGAFHITNLCFPNLAEGKAGVWKARDVLKVTRMETDTLDCYLGL